MQKPSSSRRSLRNAVALFGSGAVLVGVACSSMDKAPDQWNPATTAAAPPADADYNNDDPTVADAENDDDGERRKTVDERASPEPEPKPEPVKAEPPPAPTESPVQQNRREINAPLSGVATTAPTTPPMTTVTKPPMNAPKTDPVAKEPPRRVLTSGEVHGDVNGLVDGKKTGAKGKNKGGEDAPVAIADVTTTEPKEEEKKPEDVSKEGGTFVHAGTNPFIDTARDALSTFAIDVDTGSFTFARRFLKEGNLPPDAAVRVEEWVNAMHYSYETPAKDAKVPFAVHVAAAPSPITKGKHVVRVALKGKEVSRAERQPTNLVFLVDVSGSMQEADKLPLARESLKMLVNQLREDDQVAIVTYAGETRIALPTTSAMNKTAIFKGIDSLTSGGGTNMGSGMELAYREATKGLGGGRSARVMVLSDGDANIGTVGHEEMLKSIRGYVSEGVMMSTVGFGTGNYNDHLMEQLADAGNGNYSYIDSAKTAQKVFVEAIDGTLEVIAQDVKIQVEWNKDAVKSYRLLGYENRDVADKDFRNDKKDAGEIGAGHTVTALYEVELFSPTAKDDLGTVRIRAKKPRGTKAEEIAVAMPRTMMKDSALALDDDAIAASAVALAAEILRGSPYAEGRTLSEAAELLMGAAVGKHAAERKELARELLLVEPRLARR